MAARLVCARMAPRLVTCVQSNRQQHKRNKKCHARPQERAQMGHAWISRRGIKACLDGGPARLRLDFQARHYSHHILEELKKTLPISAVTRHFAKFQMSDVSIFFITAAPVGWFFGSIQLASKRLSFRTFGSPHRRVGGTKVGVSQSLFC